MIQYLPTAFHLLLKYAVYMASCIFQKQNQLLSTGLKALKAKYDLHIMHHFTHCNKVRNNYFHQNKINKTVCYGMVQFIAHSYFLHTCNDDSAADIVIQCNEGIYLLISQ